jgi:alcohol dehydrogenase class IV
VIASEPDIDVIDGIVREFRPFGASVVVGLGGGAVIDAAKAIAAMMVQPGELLDYLEVVGKGQPLEQKPLPVIAIPTTAGTGAEVTKNAVLGVPGKGVKVSLRHPSILPRVALVDPELAVTVPPAQTAASGMDALTQLLEPLVCRRANPMTDALCRQGIPLVVRSLERAVSDGSDGTAREDLAAGALFSGMALANSGLGAVHGFAAPIGGMYPAPHGAVCAVLLPWVWQTNLRVAQALGCASIMDRFQEAAALLVGSADALPEASVTFLQDLAKNLQIPGLASYGVQAGDLEEIATKAARASSMKANPVDLNQADLVSILRAAL